ncbi:MAG: precorrin-8X methylmutase [Synergistaceae bacterium]|jgi:precorrin-8X/cobalt-precorrin-8 methylmutase|nr:precorrin-8X methylmutase [Synergistaceae bacterium]
MRPEEIERASMAIIERELLERGLAVLSEVSPIVMRVIHATADFDFAGALTFSEGAAAAGKKALAQGVTVVTDTWMAACGISKKRMAENGGIVRCYMADEDVALEALERGMTRAAVSMERAAAETPEAVFVVGNAPTALLRLCGLVSEGQVRPSLIVGVPVGFVNVLESKEVLTKMTGVPWIAARGRKGGSSVAAAIVNALLYS